MPSIIDLRSDTSSLPTHAMRQAMAEAPVGNDDFAEDPSINRLESHMASLLGKEAAVFVLSGTMANLLGVMSQTEPGDSVVIGERFHIFDHEGRAMRRIAQVSFLTAPDCVTGGRLRIDPDKALAAAEPGAPAPRLLCMENTVNRPGGVLLPLEHMAELRAWAKKRGMGVHLDGARFFNACCALGVEPAELASHANTVQVVFTKALAAPGGGVLVGSRETIERARDCRWMLGGNWKQGGHLAAACMVALTTMRECIQEDFDNARFLAEGLDALPGIWIDLENVVTNILYMHVIDPQIDAAKLKTYLEERGGLTGRMKDGEKGKFCRLVTHRDTDRQAVGRFVSLVAEALEQQR